MIEATGSRIPYPLFRRGKVRDVYDLDPDLLIVATDRLSAFDVVLPTQVPGKGALLTAISTFWFEQTRHIVPNHLSGRTVASLGLPKDVETHLIDRSTIAMRADRIEIECVVRGYLAGSGWKEYECSGTLGGELLPSGLVRASRLPEPRFTPAIKNDHGHDENINTDRLKDEIGAEVAGQLEQLSLALYAYAAEMASDQRLILADTKFEFGFINESVHLIDEIFTPDSSRYWDAASWNPGSEPASFDKQPVRDWLESTGWDKSPPGPALPDVVVSSTFDRYQALANRLRDAPMEIT